MYRTTRPQQSKGHKTSMAKVVIQEGLHKPKYILPGGRYHTHTNTHTGYLIQHVPHTNVLLTYTQTYEEIDK